MCGSKTGDIHPTDVDLHQKFRNPYEKTKLQAEILFREYAYRRKTKCYIFRPSTIAGRGLTCEDNNCTEYHLANREETLHIDHISWMLESINITGFTFVENEPEDHNSLERLYYRSLGKVYTPYMISGPMNFDTSNLKPTEGRLGVTCPRIDQVHFGHLINYAKAKRFGLDELM